MKNFYNKKTVISGNIVETFEFQDPVLIGFKRKVTSTSTLKPKPKNPIKVIMSRIDSLRRTSRNLRRLINANPDLDKFITLTFKKNLKDVKKANRMFHRFMDRLKYFHGKEVKYIAVIEFQKRGAVHYHCLMNIPYTSNKQLKKVWKKGFVNIKMVKKIDNKSIFGYISKYIEKANGDPRLAGKKRYLPSQNLKKPIIFLGKDHNEMQEFIVKKTKINIDKQKPDRENNYLDPQKRRVTYKHFTGNENL